MEYRNAKYNRHGTIDCEIEHPKLGWVPFTASSDDTERFGRELYAELIQGEIAPYVAPIETPEELAFRLQAEADEAAKSEVKADSFVSNFIAMKPAQVVNYIDANVTNLASAKNVIEKLALMVLLLARREFR